MLKLKDFVDKYKNQPCVIYGAGPSINFIDTKPLEQFISIGVNSGILANKNIDFFLSDDQGIHHWDYFYNLNCINLLYENKLKKYSNHLNAEKTVFFKHKSFFSPPNNYNFDGIKLTKEEILIGSRTSMGTSLNVAYIFGCNPVILIGNDCKKSKEGYRYFWQYWDKDKQPKRLDYEFNQSNQNKGFDTKAYIEYLNYFSIYNKEIIEKEFNIIDCSDSDHNIFPKMSLKEILDKYGEKR